MNSIDPATSKVALHLYLDDPYDLISRGGPANDDDLAGPRFAKQQNPLPCINAANSEEIPENVERFSTVTNTADITPEVAYQLHGRLLEVPSTCTTANTRFLKRGLGIKTKTKPDTIESPRLKYRETPTIPLGFTWTLNINDFNRVKPRLVQPTYDIMLGHNEESTMNHSLEPVISAQGSDSATPYEVLENTDVIAVRKSILNDRQKKMSVKLAEWLDEYNQVSRRQQEYLQRVRQLRHDLQTRSEQSVIVSVDSPRISPRKSTRRKYPVYTLSRIENKSVNQGPEAFPSRPYAFHDTHAHRHAQSKFQMVPHITPRKLAPIVTRVKTNKHNKNGEGVAYKDSPRPEMNSMKTEYEPFETIAKRNKLNLNQILSSSVSYRQHGHRIPISMSTVTIISDVPEDTDNTLTPVEQTYMKTHKSLSSVAHNKEE